MNNLTKEISLPTTELVLHLFFPILKGEPDTKRRINQIE